MTICLAGQRGFVPLSVLIFLFTASASWAQPETMLGARGDWQAIKSGGSFESGGRQVCTIRSTNKISGGRRQRPRISVEVNNSKLTVDPDIYLTGIITGIAVIEARSYRSQPKRFLIHRMRVDRGSTIAIEIANPRDGQWRVNPKNGDLGGFVREMRNGKRLIYEWKIGRAHKLYQFDLKGFVSLSDLVSSNPKCAIHRQD